MRLSEKQKSVNIISAFILVGLVAAAIRLYINFSTYLIPGTNGAYYLLQVRHILQYGTLSFKDMPFLFYLDAAIIKVISVFTGGVTDNLIVNVVKFVDSVGLPLLLIPLFYMLRKHDLRNSAFLQVSIAAYCVLSFAPMALIAEIQKNAFAMVFLFAGITSLIRYLKEPSVRKAIRPLLWFGLTAITHFGTFSFLMCFVLVLILVLYRKKAIVPAIIIAITGLSLIAIFDISRFYRLLNVFSLAFHTPMIIYGILKPSDIFVIVFSWTLIIAGFIYLRKNTDLMTTTEKAILTASSLVLAVCANPVLDVEFFLRLSLFTVIPQILILYIITANLKKHNVIIISLILCISTVFSVFPLKKHLGVTFINRQEYVDLEHIKEITDHQDKSIILARHGLEWWVAWVVQTDVEHEKAVGDKLPDDYSNIYFLKQLRMHYPDGPAKEGHFHEKVIPDNTKIVYESEYFVLYELID